MDLLKKVCVNMNVACVVVIHQPSYEVFSHFDRLIMLSNGKCVYADRTDQIPSFLEDIGRSVPEHRIPREILEAASNRPESADASWNQSNQLVQTQGKKLIEEIKQRKKPSTFCECSSLFSWI